MQEELYITKAQEQDIDAIHAILGEHDLPFAGVDEHIATFLVARQSQGIVGVCGLEVYGKDALLRSVAVTERLRGHGVGERLYAECLHKCHELGVSQLYLLTTTAEAYFARKGFSIITREMLPQSLHASHELQGICPASATVMMKRLEQ